MQTGVTDALGNSTTYGYNSLNDRLESVTSGSSTVSYNYETVGSLSKITSPSGTVYNFTYDEFGNTKTVYVGAQKLTENFYDINRGLLDYSVYGNDYIIDYNYDMLDRVTEKLYNGVVKVKFSYDKFGNLYEKTDLFTNTTYRYSYDLIGRLTGVKDSNGTSLNYVYDEFNRIEKYVAKFGDNSNITEYIYGDSAVSGQKDGLIYGVKQNDVQRISYAYDELARLDTRTLGTTTPFVTQYGYHAGAIDGTTTTLVKTVQNGSDIYEYAYDAVGNITQIKLNGAVYESYTYDSLYQLKTVTRGTDIYEYTYDNGGNIQSVTLNGEAIKSYGYTDTNWKDKLTSFNGETITYDKIGNPLTYRDGYNFTWSNGRQLTSIRQGTNNISYLYNADGLRASKTANGTTTDYYWLEGVLLGQKTGNDYITYLYDENGAAYGLIYNNTYLYYTFNAQGDVVGLVSNGGGVIARYDYDAWGNVLSITDGGGADISQNVNHIANINPIRYRGYYYDSETGLYYVSSRYYDPEIGRWINADGYVSTGQGVLGNNMFAYCGNNPVNRVDYTGQFWSEIWEFAKTAVAEIGKAMGVMSPAYAGCGGAAAVDGPLPFGDVVAVAGAALLTVGAIGYGIYQAAQAPAISIPKAEEKAEAIPAPPPTPTVIYRYGGTNPGNLTPKAKDKYSGLSFSTVPMPGAAVTTIEALNATGVVYAVQDGSTHVSVRPVGATMEDWINAGSGSIWTQAVKSVVIKWDGGIKMVDITEIMDMLDWHMPSEIQSKGISLARNTETIIPFIQPLTPKHNKNVWENCAVIIAEKGDENLKPYLVELLEWLQDMNWPGAFCILNRLQKYSDNNSICNAINVCIEKAKKSRDEVWESNLRLLLHKQ